MSKTIEEQESKVERGIALLLCAIVLLVPMMYIEHGYDTFTSEHGEAREGAAGAGLALAVVFRTVSRTVLRTVVRTSARAGVRASLKGAIKNAARTAIRQKTKDTAKKLAADQEKARTSNLKSMFFCFGIVVCFMDNRDWFWSAISKFVEQGRFFGTRSPRTA